MKDLTLSLKITIGFGLLLLISAILGSIAVISMKGVEGDSVKLAEVYVPEVDIGNNIERYSQLTMYDIRGYSLNEDKNLLASGRESLAKVVHYLDEAKAHAEEHSLDKLKELEARAREHINEYRELVNKTEELDDNIDSERKEMDNAAASYMEHAMEYYHSQNGKLDREISRGASKKKIQERHSKLEYVAQLINLTNDSRVKNFKFQASGELEYIESAIANFPKIHEILDKVREITTQKVDLDALDTLDKEVETYQEAIGHYLKAWKSLQQTNRDRAEAAEEVLKSAQEIAHIAMDNTDEIADSAASSLSAASLTMIIGLIIALVVGIALAAYLIRSITKPIINAVQTIQDANAQVLAASDQIASSATGLADGATQQASSVEEISATIEQSTANNQQNADNANEANILAKGANDAASEGNHKIKDLMSSMEKITEASEQIAKIVKTIDEIAFQTNLLALNAAVEAARAGEHGLGFAVVADEVKNLAQRSADSAKETADIIQTTIEQIKHGNTIANDTNEAFADILDKAGKTSNLINEIAVSVKEQASGMNQIAAAMGQIDENTQTNAASSEEAAAASEELNAQANMMMASVSEVAKMVGLDTEDIPATSSSVRKKPKMLAAKPASKAKKPAKKEEEGVFELDDDDLTEF